VKRIADFIDRLSEKTGKVISLVILGMVAVTTVEVVARYVFNHPTMWAWPVNRQLFGVYILFGGIYALRQRGHIRIEIFYNHFPPRMKGIARWIGFIAFLLVMGVLIWQGTWMGWNAVAVGEMHSNPALALPLYPLKVLIPITAFLFLLEGIVLFLRGED
jgi:TRAP-type mannitol/chloroaromatic compound transport system permease small subunit